MLGNLKFLNDPRLKKMYNDRSFKTFSLRTSTMMDTCARLLCCSFLLGYLSVSYAAFASFRPYRLPKPGARAIISLGIRLPPTRSSILTSDFDNKVSETVHKRLSGNVYNMEPEQFCSRFIF